MEHRIFSFSRQGRERKGRQTMLDLYKTLVTQHEHCTQSYSSGHHITGKMQLDGRGCRRDLIKGKISSYEERLDGLGLFYLDQRRLKSFKL